ncbi:MULTISPECIES: hypothetical protein [Cupriavidus]|uniref:hypothetical protein n=1 Tax=Cupriavidus taiwanensis TaxID=164546 RepID=UPI0020C6FFC3|nr:hypothetical protein [Cupriavidus taiwanensis]
MLPAPSVALDLPLRVLVRDDPQGSTRASPRHPNLRAGVDGTWLQQRSGQHCDRALAGIPDQYVKIRF